MLAFLQYLFALVIASHRLPAPAATVAAPDWIGMALVASGFWVLAAAASWRLARRSLSTPSGTARTFALTLSAGRLLALGAFWIVSQPLHSQSIPHELGISNWVLVPHLVRLLPMAVLVILLRAALHPVGRRLGLEPPTLGTTVVFELRQALLPLAPLLPLLALWDVLFLAPLGSTRAALRDVIFSLPAVQSLLTLTLLLGALLVMPFLLRLLWRAYPMPPGRLRSRLDDYALRVKLRARDILVWPTGGAHVNAAVVGALPRFRYVFVTDGLLQALDDEEVEAVFAHEAGHARRGHVLLFLGFTAILILADLTPGALGETLAAWAGAVSPLLRSLIVLVIWIGVVFGWISRRFEQEADVYGLDTLPVSIGPDGRESDHPFARALERIGEELGGIREVTGWRHFSIADRVEFVRAYLADPAVRSRYRRNIRLMRGALLLAIGCFGVAAASRLPREVAAIPVLWRSATDADSQLLGPLQAATNPAAPPALRAANLLLAANLARRAGRDETALRWLREAAALAPGEPVVLMAYATSLEEAGRPLGARLAWEELKALPGLSSALAETADEALRRLDAPQ